MAIEQYYGTGRRKESKARVFLRPVKKGKKPVMTVNGKPYDEFFDRATAKMKASLPFAIVDKVGHFDAIMTVKGGGNTGQAEAISLGVARALDLFDDTFRPALRAAGVLTRDSRSVERKKVGKPKARRSKQFSKR